MAIGPQAFPSYPGSDEIDFAPYFNVDRKRGDEPFDFEAPDQHWDFNLVDSGGFKFGPVVSFEEARKAEDVGADVPKIKFSVEPGAFASFNLSDSFRLRGEIRKAVTGHKGWIGVAGADYIARDGDAWLFSIGPRVTWGGNRYEDAWFGITPETALATGLPAYDPDSGIHAYGAAASFLTQLSDRWGITTFAKYDRLVGDAADSPLTRIYGSRDQFSGGVGLSYTWGGGR